jgi:hypothetical protein
VLEQTDFHPADIGAGPVHLKRRYMNKTKTGVLLPCCVEPLGTARKSLKSLVWVSSAAQHETSC